MTTATTSRSGAEHVSESVPAAVQLRLLPGGGDPNHPDWVLDERTRTVGRQGVAQAREILRRVQPPYAVRRAS